ncbi:MAG: branched-chain amino acid ABC transporter permease [Deltaproteobacteria bacterium]|nr:branched-chain amino acid ABC transporter permease [Deltaproteobacteria bacterium]
MLLLVVIVAGLAVLPLVVSSFYIRHLVIVAMLYAIIASNWDLSLGYGGIFNFAHAAFFALGAYTAGILAKNFGVDPWLAIPAAGGVAVLASIIVCLPVLRVKGIYVCLVTFAFSQLCLQVVRSQREITGGAHGLTSVPPISIGSYSFVSDGKLAYYYLVLILLIASTVYLIKVVKSDFGLGVVALRDFEDYAISRGVPLARHRMLTLMASAIFTGMTGAIYTLYTGVAALELFGFGYTTTLLSMVLLGGMASIYGPIMGAFIVGFMLEFLMELGAWRFLVLAALTILVLVYYPGGIFGGLKGLYRRLATTRTRSGASSPQP